MLTVASPSSYAHIKTDLVCKTLCLSLVSLQELEVGLLLSQTDTSG